MRFRVALMAGCLALLGLATFASAQGAESITLENEQLRLEFGSEDGALSAVRNKLTGETYAIRGDGILVERADTTIDTADFRLVSMEQTGETFQLRYEAGTMGAEVVWRLGATHHFAEKRVTILSRDDYDLKRITVGQPTFDHPDITMVCYKHPEFSWIADYVRAKHGREYTRPPESEPSKTFFGRSAAGGFFAGMAVPYDDSHLDGNTLTLSIRPNMRMKAGERLECEPLYIGVYRRGERDHRADEWRPMPAATLVGPTGGEHGGGPASGTALETVDSGTSTILPLPSESMAMTAMTSAMLGPPRHGLTALACGWHCEMTQDAYETEEALEGDLRSLDFLASLGLDGVTDSHPWGGETARMAALREGDHYVPGDRVRRFVEYARGLGLKVTQWPTMNNTHPWRKYGGPLRPDRPDWFRGVDGEPVGNAGAHKFEQRLANCLASEPFFDWLKQIAVDDAMGTGLYESWCMDGDFWGTGAYFNTILPVTCFADNHRHLPGDANYACQRQLARLTAAVRQQHPDTYILMCRPAMDLGVWALRDVDACFTLVESGTDGSNIAGGNEIRTASRIRVHHHFFPHWLDQSLLFPSYGNPNHTPEWPSEHIDYLMISALSCSPNLLLYLPTKTGIPEADKAEIRKWLTWGRENIAYLNVRRDLDAWPAPGVVDGSAHIVDNEGLIFLFNPDDGPRAATFALTDEAIGLRDGGSFRIHQAYPASSQSVRAGHGETVSWEIPGKTATILRIQPDDLP